MKNLILITSLLTIASMIATGQVAYVQHNSFSLGQNNINIEHYTVPIEVSNILNGYTILEIKEISQPEKFIKRVDDINLYGKSSGYEFKLRDPNGTICLMSYGSNWIIAKDLLFRVLWITITRALFSYSYKHDMLSLSCDWSKSNWLITPKTLLKYNLISENDELHYGWQCVRFTDTYTNQNRITRAYYDTTNWLECNVVGIIEKGGDIVKR